jgi:hypothetical protein
VDVTPLSRPGCPAGVEGIFRLESTAPTSFHRAARGPGTTPREQAFHHVDGLVLREVQDIAGALAGLPRVLVLGCGIGGSLLYLARELPITVALNAVEFFSASTEWHSRDGAPGSPHYGQPAGNRAVGKGALATGPHPAHLSDRAVPAVSVVLRPAIRRSWSIRRATARRDPPGCVLAFCLIQIVYVTVTGVLFAFGEAPRYRFQVDPLIWLMAALSLSRLLLWLRRRRRQAPAPEIESQGFR